MLFIVLKFYFHVQSGDVIKMVYSGRICSVLFVIILLTAVRFVVLADTKYFPLQVWIIGIAAACIAYIMGREYDKTVMLSHRDTLTGLYNRRFVHKKVPVQLNFFRKKRGPIAISIVDMNDFKIINDTCGHEYGDAVLIRFADILGKCVRKKDIVARWGGDEFLIVAFDVSRLEMEKINQRIYRELRRFSMEIHINVTISIGTAISPDDGNNINELINAADADMYSYKLTREEIAWRK